MSENCTCLVEIKQVGYWLGASGDFELSRIEGLGDERSLAEVEQVARIDVDGPAPERYYLPAALGIEVTDIDSALFQAT